MTVALARRFKVDVSTDNVNFVPINGMTDFNPQETPTLQKADDYDSSGFNAFEKTMTGGKFVVKANRKLTGSGAFDPGQELVRATAYQFGTLARIYFRYYDRNGAAQAYSAYCLAEYNQSKTAVADIEEVTMTFTADGVVSSITNPIASGALVPQLVSATPSGVAAGGLVTVAGAYFTGATKVQDDGQSMVFTVVSDSHIVAEEPAALATPAAPVPTTATTGGTVAAGVYQVEVAYVGANGESLASASGSVTTTGSTSTLTVPSPSASTGATGWYAYVSQAGGTAASATRQQAAGSPTAIGTNLVLTAPPTTTGVTPPSKAGIVVTTPTGASAALAYTRG